MPNSIISNDKSTEMAFMCVFIDTSMISISQSSAARLHATLQTAALKNLYQQKCII